MPFVPHDNTVPQVADHRIWHRARFTAATSVIASLAAPTLWAIFSSATPPPPWIAIAFLWLPVAALGLSTVQVWLFLLFLVVVSHVRIKAKRSLRETVPRRLLAPIVVLWSLPQLVYVAIGESTLLPHMPTLCGGAAGLLLLVQCTPWIGRSEDRLPRVARRCAGLIAAYLLAAWVFTTTAYATGQALISF